MRELYELCPQFNDCSAPKCPLDSKLRKRSVRLKGEEKCGVRKYVRLKIVKDNPGYYTCFGGLTPREYSARVLSHRLKSKECN